jgi:gliding motility-associated-like protein
MSKNYTPKNIEDSFRQAFDQWEAPHSPSEMQSAWNQVSAHLPQAPVQSPVSNPGIGAAGKLAAWIGGSAALVATAVLVYTTVMKQPDTAALSYSPVTKEISQNQVSTQQPLATDKNISVQTPVKSRQDGSKSQGYTPVPEKPAQNSSDAFRNNSIVNTANSPVNNTAVNTASSGQASSTSSANTNTATINTPSPKTPPDAGSLTVNLSDTRVCTGTPVSLSSNKNQGLIQWGDGSTQPLKSENHHIYNGEGTFSIVISSGTLTSGKTITIVSQPHARFDYAHVGNYEIHFKDLSENADNYYWNFGDGYTAASANPVHIYRDSGLFKVVLVTGNTGQCTDTAVKLVRVLHMDRPDQYNVFTPNGDGENDELVMNVPPHTYFHLEVMDKSGRVVFETDDSENHWKGQQRNGLDAAAGTYFYLLQFRPSGDDKMQQEQGVIELKR